MPQLSWTDDFPAAITICDVQGTILYMNRQAAQLFESSGGAALIGSNVLDCHPQRARGVVLSLLAAGQSATFTVEEGKARRVVYDAPWYSDGRYCGLVELSFALPHEMKNFVRSEQDKPGTAATPVQRDGAAANSRFMTLAKED